MRDETHGEIALRFLSDSDREFDAEDHLQASEKLWGAASHAVMAVAIDREWGECRTHRELKNAVGRLAEEINDKRPIAEFGIAERFHKNFYHNEMSEYDIQLERPIVHEFVRRTLDLTNGAQQRHG